MVMESRGRAAGPLGTDRKESTHTISALLCSALTIRSVPRESIKSSYWTMLLFAVLLDVAMVASLVVGMFFVGGAAAVMTKMPVLGANFLATLLILVLGCWLASYLNCMLVGAAHSPKEHLIFLSAMVYIPILVPPGMVLPRVLQIGVLALVILNSFYLNSCYSPMLPYEDARLSLLHNVYVVVALYLLYELLIYELVLSPFILFN